MTGAQIAILILQYGLPAIQQLIAKWNTPMTPDELQAVFALASTSYDQYIANARAALTPPAPTVPTPPMT